MKRSLQTHAAALIDGTLFAAAVRKEISSSVAKASSQYGRPPRLAVVLVGDRPDSARYVQLKQKAAVSCGIATVDRRLPASSTTNDILSVVKSLDADDNVDGVLVQLPLPDGVNQSSVLEAVSASKDVDGFHPQNLGALARLGEVHRRRVAKHEGNGDIRRRRMSGGDAASHYNLDIIDAKRLGCNVPCTALGCVELLDRSNVDMCGKHVVVIGRSNIVGLPLALLALHRDATVTVCHVQTPQDHGDKEDNEVNIRSQASTDLAAACRMADILITAAGSPGLIRGNWIKPGAVVIDVGFNVVEGDASSSAKIRICGDVSFDEAATVASKITPVPGGVGPMTIAMLMRNTLNSFVRRMRS